MDSARSNITAPKNGLQAVPGSLFGLASAD
jgi:hypothetical protein